MRRISGDGLPLACSALHPSACREPLDEHNLSGRLSGGPTDAWVAQIAQSIAAIAADDPERRRKAFKAFLETGLAREFGIADIGGAEFQRLVAIVQDAMLADAQISDAIERAGELLLRPGFTPNSA